MKNINNLYSSIYHLLSSKLCTQGGAQTHNPNIKSHALATEPAKCSYTSFKIMQILLAVRKILTLNIAEYQSRITQSTNGPPILPNYYLAF